MDYWVNIPDLRNYGANDWLNHKTVMLDSPMEALAKRSEEQERQNKIAEMIKPTLNVPGVFVRYDTEMTVSTPRTEMFQQEYEYMNDGKYYYKLFCRNINGQYYDVNFKTKLDHEQLRHYFDVCSQLTFSVDNTIKVVERIDVNELAFVNILSEYEYYSALSLIE